MVFLTKKDEGRLANRGIRAKLAIMFLGITETDGLALAMLAMIMLAFGVILMLLVCMLRSSSKRDAQVDLLLEEFQEESKKMQPAKTARAEKEKAWERDGDWWKGA